MQTTSVNVHPLERLGSVTLGGALLLRTLRHPTPGKAILALDLLWRGASGHSLLYQALGVSTADGNLGQTSPLHVTRAITIGKSADELYQLWRSPQKLSQSLTGIAEVTEIDNEHSHWSLSAPGGLSMQWNTRILEDRPGALLRWETVEGAQVPHTGTLRFQPAPAKKGTEMTLSLGFDPPGGAPGASVARHLRFLPGLLADQMLRRFKSFAETGEIPTLAHNPAARPGEQIAPHPCPPDQIQPHTAAQAR